ALRARGGVLGVREGAERVRRLPLPGVPPDHAGGAGPGGRRDRDVGGAPQQAPGSGPGRRAAGLPQAEGEQVTDRGGKGGSSVLKNGKLVSIRPETDGK